MSFVIGNLSLAAEQYLRDVPEGHYAYDAVYDLIRRGVTRGYPDGTFRGKAFMNRFEIAVFLSKLARSINVKNGVNEKLIAELRSELSLIQFQSIRREKFSGEFTARWRAGQAPGQRGARADYRLKAELSRRFGETAGLKIGLDTLDAGFNGGSRDLVRDLLAAEGEVKIGDAIFKLTSGPGEVTHFDDGLFPGENGVVYRRPWRGAALEMTSGRAKFTLEYLARSTAESGAVSFSELSLKISRSFSAATLTLNPRIFFGSDGARDARLELSARGRDLEILAGLAKNNNFPEGLYLRGILSLGNYLKLFAQKVGGQYREQFSINLFDVFDRNLPDGAANFGLQLTRDFAGGWSAGYRGDYTDPGGINTHELRVDKKLNSESSLGIVYQAYQAQAVSQSAGLTASLAF